MTIRESVLVLRDGSVFEGEAIGADPVGGTALQYGQFVQRETDKWRVIVKESGAKAE